MNVIQLRVEVGEDRVLRVPLPKDTPTGPFDVVVVLDPLRPISPEERRAAAHASLGVLKGLGLSVDDFLAERREDERRGEAVLGWRDRRSYVAVYEQTPNGWSAYVPDLPGCVAAGDTREEVERLIREAARLHVAALREGNEPVPEPGAWTGVVEVATS